MVKSPAVIAGGVAGGGGVTVGVGYGVHKATPKYIEDYLKDDLLPDNKTEDWKDLETIRKVSLAKENLYGLDKVGVLDTPDGTKLLAWCKQQRSVAYGSVIYQDHRYVNKVKTYCVYSIKSKLSKDSSVEPLDVFNTSSDGGFKTNFDKLSNLTGTTDGDISKLPSLNEIKNNYSNKDKDYPHLKEWCRWALGKGFQDENNDLFKLTKHLCTKAKSAVSGSG